MDLAVEKVLQNCYSRVAKMMQRGTICMHKFEDTWIQVWSGNWCILQLHGLDLVSKKKNVKGKKEINKDVGLAKLYKGLKMKLNFNDQWLQLIMIL